VPTFVDRSCRVVIATDSYGRILGFIDRSRYFFFQAAPQLYSRGWVDPVPDPLLLRKSGSAKNRKPDLWICSQELWPLFITYQAIKTNWCGGVTPRILNLVARWRWKISFPPLNFTPGGRVLGTHWIWGLGEGGRRAMFCPCTCCRVTKSSYLCRLPWMTHVCRNVMSKIKMSSQTNRELLLKSQSKNYVTNVWVLRLHSSFYCRCYLATGRHEYEINCVCAVVMSSSCTYPCV
jgi:hypothetical protein